MKIIDRYLFRSFLLPLVCCLVAFTMVFVIVDLFDNLSDFIKGETPVLTVFVFYLRLIPASIVYIVPISLLLAALYSLSLLTKNNELTAMRASGMSLTRLMLPFVLTGLLASVTVLAVNETLAPQAAYWTKQFVRLQRNRNNQKIFLVEHLPHRNQEGRRSWLIDIFDTRTCEMKGVKIEQFRDNGLDRRKIVAESGAWIDGRWWLKNVEIQEYSDQGLRLQAPVKKPMLELTDFNETPDNFLNEVKLHRVGEPRLLSARDLYDYIRQNPQSGHQRNNYMVDIHSRLSMPWACLIVTMLGVPFGYHTGRRGAMRGALLALGLFFLYYVTMNMGVWAGKRGYIAPLVAGWLPVLLGLVPGIVMLSRMR